MAFTSRRRFLQASAAAFATGTGLAPLAACTRNSQSPLGIQLYTVRERMAQGVPDVLRSLANIGYSEVEFAGYFDHTAQSLLRLLQDNSLCAPAAHIQYETMQSNLESTIEFAQILGHKYLVVPWLSEDQRLTVDNYLKHADIFNKWGEQCRASGIQLCYHNHAFEFSPLDDKIPFEILLQNTDPDLVAIELDVYWISKAGYSPFDYFSSYPGRFPLWHLKDLAADGSMVDVGDGEIDFVALLAQKEQAGLRHGFVEHDSPGDSMASAKQSYRYLQDKW